MIESYIFVRDFLSKFFENNLICGRITQSQYYQHLAVLEGADLKAIAAQLFECEPACVEIPGAGTIRLVYLREVDGSEFPFLLAVPKKRRIRKQLTCFVGHRFIPEVEVPLRFNLAHIFEPYRIVLNWAAQDLSASDLFAEINRRIDDSDMCIFDTRATVQNPNVFIEIGIAYCLKRPMIVAEFRDPSGTSAEVPSDLQGLFRIRYRTYQELIQQLYFGLPTFFSRHFAT